MFENKNEKQAKEEILGLVKEYAERFHNQKRILRRDREFHMRPACMTVRRW